MCGKKSMNGYLITRVQAMALNISCSPLFFSVQAYEQPIFPFFSYIDSCGHGIEFWLISSGNAIPLAGLMLSPPFWLSLMVMARGPQKSCIKNENKALVMVPGQPCGGDHCPEVLFKKENNFLVFNHLLYCSPLGIVTYCMPILLSKKKKKKRRGGGLCL